VSITLSSEKLRYFKISCSFQFLGAGIRRNNAGAQLAICHAPASASRSNQGVASKVMHQPLAKLGPRNQIVFSHGVRRLEACPFKICHPRLAEESAIGAHGWLRSDTIIPSFPDCAYDPHCIARFAIEWRRRVGRVFARQGTGTPWALGHSPGAG